jgi:hypothetical protein
VELARNFFSNISVRVQFREQEFFAFFQRFEHKETTITFYTLPSAPRPLPSAQKIFLAILPRIAYYYWQATEVTKTAKDLDHLLIKSMQHRSLVLLTNNSIYSEEEIYAKGVEVVSTVVLLPAAAGAGACPGRHYGVVERHGGGQ